MDPSPIDIKSTDGLIDLSPCIGIYQEAVFFENYDIDADIQLRIALNPELKGLYTGEERRSPLDQKILFLVSLETRQIRYRKQVAAPFVNGDGSKVSSFFSFSFEKQTSTSSLYLTSNIDVYKRQI